MKNLLFTTALAMVICFTSCGNNKNHMFTFSVGTSTEFADSISIKTKQVLTAEEKDELKVFITKHIKKEEHIQTILNKALVLADAKTVKFERSYINDVPLLPMEDRKICYTAIAPCPIIYYVFAVLIFCLGIGFGGLFEVLQSKK